MTALPGAKAYPVASGTGHRPFTRHNPGGLTAPQLKWARERCRAGLTWLATEHGVTTVFTGMAHGWDMVLGACAFDIGIPFVAHIPYEAQPLGSDWSAEDRGEWLRLRSLAADEVIYGDNPGDQQAKWERMKARNAGLVQADLLFALWCGQRRGGTWSTICMAQKLGRPGILLDPVARTTRMVQPGGWF